MKQEAENQINEGRIGRRKYQKDALYIMDDRVR